MGEEKRVIDGYEEKMAIQIGSKLNILAENMMAESPYMVCECRWDNPLGIESYSNGVAGDDYLEMLTEYLSRVSGQVKQIEAERAERGVSNIPLTRDDCVAGSNAWDYENQLVVIKPEALTPSARTADKQLVLATGGFGCHPNSRGTAVFCRNLFTGESRRFERYNIAGVIDPAKMPEWTREKLSALHKFIKKESALETTPDNSPWGEVQHSLYMLPGVFKVKTASLGGIMVANEAAISLLSLAARERGEQYGGFSCYGDECDHAIVLRELLDKKLWTPNEWHDNPKEYEEHLNDSLKYWNPEYWQAREKAITKQNRAPKIQPAR